MSKNQLFQVHQITNLEKFIAKLTLDQSSFKSAKGMEVCIYQHQKLGSLAMDVPIKTGKTDSNGKTTLDVSKITKSNLGTDGYYFVKVLIEYESDGETKKGTVYRSNTFTEFAYKNEVKKIYYYLVKPEDDQGLTTDVITSQFEGSLKKIEKKAMVKSVNSTVSISPGKIHIGGDIELKTVGKLEVDLDVKIFEYSGYDQEKFIDIEFENFDTKRKGLLWVTNLVLTDKILSKLLEDIFEDSTEKQINDYIKPTGEFKEQFESISEFLSVTIYRLRYPVVETIKMPLPPGLTIDIRSIVPYIGIGFPRIFQ